MLGDKAGLSQPYSLSQKVFCGLRSGHCVCSRSFFQTKFIHNRISLVGTVNREPLNPPCSVQCCVKPAPKWTATCGHRSSTIFSLFSVISGPFFFLLLQSWLGFLLTCLVCLSACLKHRFLVCCSFISHKWHCQWRRQSCTPDGVFGGENGGENNKRLGEGERERTGRPDKTSRGEHFKSNVQITMQITINMPGLMNIKAVTIKHVALGQKFRYVSFWFCWCNYQPSRCFFTSLNILFWSSVCTYFIVILRKHTSRKILI